MRNSLPRDAGERGFDCPGGFGGVLFPGGKMRSSPLPRDAGEGVFHKIWAPPVRFEGAAASYP